jgi:hypothetical protein
MSTSSTNTAQIPCRWTVIATATNALCTSAPHLDSSPRLSMCAHIFLDLFQDLTGTILSLVCDVPVDSDTSVRVCKRLRLCYVSQKKNAV